MLKLNSRTTFEAIVQEALNGKDEDKANEVRTKIIKALASDNMIYMVYTREWLRGEIDQTGVTDVLEISKNMEILSNEIKNSDLSLTYKYILYTDSSNTDEYVEGDDYNDLYLQGDAIYDFLNMYCNLLEKYNNTYNEGLEELGLDK